MKIQDWIQHMVVIVVYTKRSLAYPSELFLGVVFAKFISAKNVTFLGTNLIWNKMMYKTELQINIYLNPILQNFDVSM